MKQNRWDCTECGVNHGANDIWFVNDVCGECYDQALNNKKKDEIERNLINKWASIGMDIPENYEDIVQDCYEDVCDTADPVNWNDGDVAIAFRRWIEKQI